MMDHVIDEMETLRSANEQKVFEIQRINGQLNKALEVIEKLPFLYVCWFLLQTVKQTVDMKDKLESDLYRKVSQRSKAYFYSKRKKIRFEEKNKQIT